MSALEVPGWRVNSAPSAPLAEASRSAQAWLVDWRIALISVALPGTLRAIPEILAGADPLGFDTVWVYAPFVKDVGLNGFHSAMLDLVSMRGAPLMYVMLGLGGIISGAEPFGITKAVAPLLHGLVVFSLYYFVKCGLHWDDKSALFVVLLGSISAVTFRFSWDMYKNALGVAFLFLSLVHLRGRPRRIDDWMFLSLGVLGILSSELTAFLLVGASGLFFIRRLVRRKECHYPHLFVAAAAAVAVLVYVGVLFVPLPGGSPLGPPPPTISFPQDYLGPSESSFSDIGDLYSTVLLLAGMTVGPLLPIAILGLVPESRLRFLTLVLSLGAFSLLVIPFAAIPLWHRWLFLLALPLVVFAARGISRLQPRVRHAYLLGLVVLSTAFMVLPPDRALPYYAAPQTLPYFPSSLMQNSVPLDDSRDVVSTIQWLNQLSIQDGILVTPISFFGWARLYSSMPAIYAFVDPRQVESGNFSTSTRVFMIYFAPGHDWFTASMLPQGMGVIHLEGKIAAYELVRN